jgi:Alr-MurF fusion protein
MLVSAIANIIKANVLVLKDTEIDTLLIDSRKISYAAYAMFVCIKTTDNDGHKYINDAYNKGVRCFLVSDNASIDKYADASFLQVADTISALQQLVINHRQQYNLPIIGITGSNGKTIVKEWLFHLLDGHYQIVKNPKSYNSQIGVALSVWEINSTHTLGIFEAGISMPNEMVKLEKIIQPTIGVFTMIGDAHQEHFKSIEQKVAEKLLLFKHTNLLCYCADNEIVHAVINKNFAGNTITWGKANTNALQILAINKQVNSSVLTVQYNTVENNFTIPFIDDASIENYCHCLCLCLHFNISIDAITALSQTLPAIAMRLEEKTGTNGCTIINDSYNNDIGALQIALDFLKQHPQHNKFTVIFSDILQSGANDQALYTEVAELIEDKKIQNFIGVGPALVKHKSLFENINGLACSFYANTPELLQQIRQLHFENECILLKGARAFKFELVSRVLEAKLHQTVLEINLDALAENYETYANLVNKDVAIMAMVKAFSYGAGALEVANKLGKLGVNYLGVAYADEGVLLRKQGVQTPIMVMNAAPEAFEGIIAYNLEPEVYNIKILNEFILVAKQIGVQNYPIHLKIDTGMHRLGFSLQELKHALDVIVAEPCIKIQSVFSHLAASDDALLDEYTERQANIFNEAISIISKQVNYTFYKHICNTSGIIRHPNLHYNMVRLGVGLYGVDNSNLLGKKIKNISRLKTTIAQIKHLQVGETVGYSRKGVVSRPSIIGTVCIGYGDGISRALSNGKGKMYVKGTLCPIIGNVCMDMCMLDMTDVPDVQEGDEVIIFGPELPITRVAEMAGTIAYEVMTAISTRVKRVYFEGE